MESLICCGLFVYVSANKCVFLIDTWLYREAKSHCEGSPAGIGGGAKLGTRAQPRPLGGAGRPGAMDADLKGIR